MKAEILSIGTELLLGQIVNTNAQYLSVECAAIGLNVYHHTVAGDNEQRLLNSFRLASSRSDLVICTGGLGPTQDDLTKDVLAEYVGRSISLHEPTMSKIADLFKNRGVEMVESNRKQALIIDGCTPLLNETGLAVGIAMTVDGTHYILLPGPPKEMKPMFQHHAIPWILSKTQDTTPLYSKMLKFAGIGESSLEHAIIDLINNQTDPTIAPYAKEAEVTIRLTTRSANVQDGENKLRPIEQEIRSRVGNYLYAEKDIPIENVIIELLQKRKQTLAVVESCTGGKCSDLLTNVSGSSQCFIGGLICYTNQMKHNLLDIPMNMLEGKGSVGSVSPEVALLLSQNLLQTYQTDYAISITGVAGPHTLENKPVGLVYIGLSQKNGQSTVFPLNLHGNREIIKLRATKSALYFLWNVLKDIP